MADKRTKQGLETIMRLYLETAEQTTPGSFHLAERKQALRDALESFKQSKILLNYNLVTGELIYPPTKKGSPHEI